MNARPETMRVPRADDFHVHARQDELLRRIGPRLASGGVGRICVMPNTRPPLCDLDQALAYRDVVAATVGPDVTVLVSLYLSPALTPAMIAEASRHACIPAVKFYPRGVTTHAGDGAASPLAFESVLAAMERYDLVLQLHGEALSNPALGIDVLNAETRFLAQLRRLHARFPGLRIVLEHVSSRAGVECVQRLGATVAATVTAHHLDLTVDDWAGQPHNYCKPVAKRRRDRDAIRTVVTDGHPRFFLGSDSAPHERAAKECGLACPGIFTSPFLLPYLADTLDRLGALARLADFTSRFGRDFYRLPPGTGTVALEKAALRIPESVDGIVPYRHGEILQWRLANR